MNGSFACRAFKQFGIWRLVCISGRQSGFEDNFSDKLSFHSDLNDADCSKLLDIEDGGHLFGLLALENALKRLECFWQEKRWIKN